MLSKPHHGFSNVALRTRQGGVVLLITLIVLVAMTLAAIALVRSVDTTNLITGNLAFKQAATLSADAGTEAAVAWLEAQPAGALWVDNKPNGYSATRSEPNPNINQSWDDFWNVVINPNPIAIPVNTLTCSPTTLDQACALPTDAAGNTSFYNIMRLCNGGGDPNNTNPSPGCAISSATTTSGGGSTWGSGAPNLQYSNQVYYRITSRVTGPRNTVSYVQTIVAM
jgi:hypothetical protein